MLGWLRSRLYYQVKGVFTRLIDSAQSFIFKAISTAVSPLKMPVDRSRLRSLQASVEHIHGPTTQSFSENEAIVFCVVKDGENLVQAFVEHYLQLGFKHIFFLDNGSTDQTIDIIKSYSQTTLLSSSEPFREYYVIFKNFLIQKFGRGQWCLVADIDEFLCFPLDKTLTEILSYLNQNSYNTLCIQMLDMFSKESVKPTKNRRVWSLKDLISSFNYYDLSNIESRKYVHIFQPEVHPGIKFLYGGIRKTVFGQNCFLTKESMFFAHEKTRLKSSHLLSCSNVADFSAVFMHYKFIDDFYSATLKAVKDQNHWRNSKEYKGYLAILEKQKAPERPELVFFQSSSFALSKENKGIDNLINHGFLFTSDKFRRFFHDSPKA